MKMYLTLLLLSIVVFVDSTPQFGFGGFGNSQNCLGSRCNQNNLGGGGFGGFGGFGGGFGNFGGYGGLGGFGGHNQNCAGSQCNQNNFGKKKREAGVDGDIDDDLSDTKSQELTQKTKELPIPNVEGNVSDTNAIEAEEQVPSIEDDKVSIDDAKAKLTENSFFEEMDPYTVVVEPLLGDMVDTSAVLETLGDDLVEAFVHEVELEEEMDRAEEVLDTELETLLESRSLDSEATRSSENVCISEAVDVVSVEHEETSSTGRIDETTSERKNIAEEAMV